MNKTTKLSVLCFLVVEFLSVSLSFSPFVARITGLSNLTPANIYFTILIGIVIGAIAFILTNFIFQEIVDIYYFKPIEEELEKQKKDEKEQREYLLNKAKIQAEKEASARKDKIRLEEIRLRRKELKIRYLEEQNHQR